MVLPTSFDDTDKGTTFAVCFPRSDKVFQTLGNYKLERHTIVVHYRLINLQ